MSSSAAKTHEQLTINELSRVHEELISIASKWNFFEEISVFYLLS